MAPSHADLEHVCKQFTNIQSHKKARRSASTHTLFPCNDFTSVDFCLHKLGIICMEAIKSYESLVKLGPCQVRQTHCINH